MNKNNFFWKALLTVCVVLLVLWTRFLYTPLVTDNYGIKYIVPQGASIKSVANDLYAKGIIHHRWFFLLLIRLRNDAHELKAGEYYFSKGTTPIKLLNQITLGTGLIYHPFTIIPGWNFKDLSDALFKDIYLRHTLPNMDNKQLMKLLGHPELTPEGQFFPDTYFFAEGTRDTTILNRAFQTMQNKLTIAWQTRTPGLPYQDRNEALIAASLIEKEAYLADERPRIAGVLVNRLRSGMLLQFDPTVIYGMGLRYDGHIRKEDLLENTPFNTYIHKGLPPTPIAMPSLGSIIATLHPENHHYFYFVARGDGSHQFSENLSDHNAAVASTRQPWYFNEDLIRFYISRGIK